MPGIGDDVLGFFSLDSSCAARSNALSSVSVNSCCSGKRFGVATADSLSAEFSMLASTGGENR
jgi:hypothetical protein